MGSTFGGKFVSSAPEERSLTVSKRAGGKTDLASIEASSAAPEAVAPFRSEPECGSENAACAEMFAVEHAEAERRASSVRCPFRLSGAALFRVRFWRDPFG
jgi:hypothetical protein